MVRADCVENDVDFDSFAGLLPHRHGEVRRDLGIYVDEGFEGDGGLCRADGLKHGRVEALAVDQGGDLVSRGPLDF